MYVKFIPGASKDWHWHPGAEMYYGESGTLELRILNSSRTIKITAGSYARVPAHVIHKGACVSKEPCLFYLDETTSVKHLVDEHGNETSPVSKN